jgi:leucyl/phenylalanyl-tRNA--protein transferase
MYGVGLGRVFFGESMFTRATDASKVALVHAVEHLHARGIDLIDCQVASAHTRSLGAVEIPRVEFLRLIAELCAEPAPPHTWRTT